MDHEWRFPCRLISWYDGDTFTLELDLGFNVKMEHTIRLQGVDTPELRGGTDLTKRAARIARSRAAYFIGLGQDIIFVSEKWAGKYGRPIGDIQVDGVSLRDWLIRNRLGIRYDGGSRENALAEHTKNALWLQERRWRLPEPGW